MDVWIHIFSSKVDIHFIGGSNLNQLTTHRNEGNNFLHQMLLDIEHKRYPSKPQTNLYKHAEDLKTTPRYSGKKTPLLYIPGGPLVWDTPRFIFRFSSVFYSKISWLRGPQKTSTTVSRTNEMEKISRASEISSGSLCEAGGSWP